METSLAITRKSASNLALAFVLLPREKRRGMSALYAFCREVDDVADEDSVPVDRRRETLQLWRDDVRLACEGAEPRLPVNRELRPIIARYLLPFEYFDELIRGVEMDLDTRNYETFAELEQYCYRVASVVGLLSIEIFGYQHPGSRDYAVYLGKALQLTNILRDVRNDAERGRVYIPREDLDRFKVDPREILGFQYSDRFRAVAATVAARAKGFYQLARESLPIVDRRSMAAAELMGTVYWRLLQKLETREFNVFSAAPTRVTKAQKIFLIFRTWYRISMGACAPNYGAP